ncbi:MAG: sensor histidine kinase [Lachnospiraceae bacterium]|nr:sensor histidine kinase [Lachnospiraceae bacterium]
MTGIYMINSLLFVVPCILLLYLAFRDQIKTPRPPIILTAAAVYLLIVLAASRIYLGADTPMKKVLLSGLSQLTGIFIFSAASSYTFSQSFFIITVVKNYSENVLLFSYQIYFMATGRMPEESVRAISYIMAALSLAAFPLICLFYKKLMRPALDYTQSLIIWRLVWVIPTCNSLIYTMVIAPDISNYTSYPGNEFFVIPVFWSMLTFASYGVLLRTIIAISRNAELREKLYLTEIQITAQQKHMRLLQTRIQETSRVRHDIRHHFLVLGNFARNKDLEGLERYLEKASELSFLQSEKVYCDNSAVNALLCYYKEQAEKEHAKIAFQVSLIEKIPVTDTELCIILGNLLENAVEACRRMVSSDRFIWLELSMISGELLMVSVKNSYEGVIHQAQDGAFFSSKMKGRRGIGISSVLSIAEKYHGMSRVEYEDQIFRVSLLLSGGQVS